MSEESKATPADDEGGDRPTHSVVLSPKLERRSAKRKWFEVGVGWDTTRGTGIRVSLNRGVSLSWRDLVDHDLFVFERKEEPR